MCANVLFGFQVFLKRSSRLLFGLQINFTDTNRSRFLQLISTAQRKTKKRKIWWIHENKTLNLQLISSRAAFKKDFSRVYILPKMLHFSNTSFENSLYCFPSSLRFIAVWLWILHFPLASFLGFHAAQPLQRGCGLSLRFPKQRQKSSLYCVESFFLGQEWDSSVVNSRQALREAQSSWGPWLFNRSVGWSTGQGPTVQLALGAELWTDLQFFNKSFGRKMLGALPADLSGMEILLYLKMAHANQRITTKESCLCQPQEQTAFVFCKRTSLHSTLPFEWRLHL